MKTANIIFKVLAYAIVLGGLALLIYYAVYPLELYKGTKYEYSTATENEMEAGLKTSNKPTEKSTVKKVVETQKSQTPALVGKWKVTYNTKDLKGSVVYNMKKEGNNFNAYTYELQDENGYGQKVPAEKTLIIKSFNGKKGKGIYKIEYEGKNYDIPCTINLTDKNTFNLSYDYYGYSDTEKWRRVE